MPEAESFDDWRSRTAPPAADHRDSRELVAYWLVGGAVAYLVGANALAVVCAVAAGAVALQLTLEEPSPRRRSLEIWVRLVFAVAGAILLFRSQASEREVLVLVAIVLATWIQPILRWVRARRQSETARG